MVKKHLITVNQVTSSIFHREIQHFRAFSMVHSVHSTLSLVFPGSQRHGRHGRRRHRRGSHHRGGRRDGGGDGGGSATGAGTAWGADWNGKINGLYIDYPIYYGTVTIYWNGLINGINHLL